MDIVDFFTASGVIGWLWLSWWGFQAVREHVRRLKWALCGYKKRNFVRWHR